VDLPVGELARGRPEEVARRVAESAVSSVAGASGASFTLWEGADAVLTAATHPDLADLVELQVTTGDGPAVTAHETGTAVEVDDTLDDERWPRMIAFALRRGIRAMLCSGLSVDGRSASVTLYSVRPRAFAPDAGTAVELLAGQALIALRQLDDYDGARTMAEQMRQAMESRSVIDVAKGMLMQALGCDADTAFAELVAASQRSQVKLADIARQLVREGPPKS
jgi:GAF domain-containing protein